MPEPLIIIILIVLCAGQVYTLFKGRLTSITYYICIAPLGYFQIWSFGSWDTSRLCGLIILIGPWLTKWKNQSGISFIRHPIFYLFIYGIMATIIGMFLWPLNAIASRSIVYSQLRGFVQIINWIIMIGVAWQIALAFSVSGAMEKARPILLGTGLVLCGYAIYQYVAYHWNLPATGIRRPIEEIIYGIGGEQFAQYLLGQDSIFRSGSLIGEPKGLGAACVFWLALLFSEFLEKKFHWRTLILLSILFFVLWLTASTSAWAGSLVCLGLGIGVILTRGRLMVTEVVFVFLVAFIIFLSFNAIVDWNSFKETYAEIINVRGIERIRDSLGDLAEQVALELLLANPILAIFGVGLGGMSFYIAEYLGGNQFLILFPNNGLLGWICNIGVLGIILLLFAVWGGIRRLFSSRLRKNEAITGIRLIGVATLIQCFIFPQTWLTSVAVGFLMAGGFNVRNGYNVNHQFRVDRGLKWKSYQNGYV